MGKSQLSQRQPLVGTIFPLVANGEGRQIRRRRKALGLTQGGLAEIARVAESTISRAENDQLSEDAPTLRDIFDALEREEHRVGGERNIQLLDLRASDLAPSGRPGRLRVEIPAWAADRLEDDLYEDPKGTVAAALALYAKIPLRSRRQMAILAALPDADLARDQFDGFWVVRSMLAALAAGEQGTGTLEAQAPDGIPIFVAGGCIAVEAFVNVGKISETDLDGRIGRHVVEIDDARAFAIALPEGPRWPKRLRSGDCIVFAPSMRHHEGMIACVWLHREGSQRTDLCAIGQVRQFGHEGIEVQVWCDLAHVEASAMAAVGRLVIPPTELRLIAGAVAFLRPRGRGVYDRVAFVDSVGDIRP